MTLNIALLGAGRIGRVHADAIAAAAGARLAAVADAAPDAAREAARRHGCEARAVEEILASPEVDAVAICTPTRTHADLIERAARAGKAIFCEKPVDLDLRRVAACLAVVEEAGAPLMLGFNRRFDPHFLALRAAVEAGRIGAVEQVVITSRDPAPPPLDYVRDSGGIFRDMTIHDFDMARFVLGEEIESVQASASVLVDAGIGALGDFDTATVVLTTAGGRQCVIVNSRRASYGYDQRVEALGSRGMIRARNPRPVAIESADARGFAAPPLHDFFMTRYADAYAAEIAAFVQAVTEGAPPSPSGRDGFLALALAEAALTSVAEGRRVPVAEILARTREEREEEGTGA